MKSIGIDIGSHSIKVVEIHSGSKGISISGFFQHKFSPNPQADHNIETIEFLRQLISNYDSATTNFNIALRTDKVSIRSKFFPFKERIKILKSLPFELEEDIPFSTDNSIFDAKVIKFIGNGAETIAYAAPKQHIEQILNLANDCNFSPTVLSEEGMALGNLIENWNDIISVPAASDLVFQGDEKTQKQIQLVLQMGHSKTIVLAFEGQTLLGVRSILWGGKNLIDAVAKKYSIPHAEAAKEIESKAFILTNKQNASFDQISFSDTIASSVRELVRDLQLTILEFKSEHNATITEASITGGASQIINLGAFLTQMLDVPVNKLEPLHKYPQVLFERNPQTEAILGLALGLAIEGLKKPRNPALNFLRGEFTRENHNLKNFLDKWTPSLKVLGGFIVVLFAYTMIRESVALDLADRTTEALKDQAKTSAGLKGKKASETAIKKFIKEKKRIATELKRLESLTSMNSATDILNKISVATPARGAINLEVKNLSIQDSNVFIEGYVKSPKEMTLLQQALSNLSVTGKVASQNPSLQKLTDKTAFAFGFEVDRELSKTK